MPSRTASATAVAKAMSNPQTDVIRYPLGKSIDLERISSIFFSEFTVTTHHNTDLTVKTKSESLVAAHGGETLGMEGANAGHLLFRYRVFVFEEF